MKKKTEDSIYKEQHMLSRAIIDRKRKAQQAILVEKRHIIQEADVTAAYLYDYYVSICQIPSWDLTNDAMVAKQIGLTVRKVGDTRRRLTKLGWIRFDTHMHQGVKHGIWYIGKEVVAAKINHETTIEEYTQLGVLTEEEYDKIQGFKIDIDNAGEDEDE